MKHLMSAVAGALLFAILIGCATVDESRAEYRQLVENFVTAYNSHDPDAVAALYDENAMLIYSDAPAPRYGRNEVAEGLRSFFRAFPDIRMNYTFFMADSNQFAIEGFWRGTHTGPLQASGGIIPPTGRKLEMRFGMFAEVGENGLIISDRGYYNIQQFINQLFPDGVPIEPQQLDDVGK